jgi:S1-C subfamily serine protease
MMMTHDPELGPPPPMPPPPAAPRPPTPPYPPRPSWGRSAVLLAAALAIAIAGVVGYTMGHRNDAVVQQPTDVRVPDNSSISISSASRRIAAKLDDSIVNITTRLSSGGVAAGTGIIISANGLALTNNHVIADTEQLRVENSADGSMHSAKVLGYSVTADVALIKIQGVSGLTPAPIGQSGGVSVGDAVVGLGNAGGNGGAPSIAPGSVTALDQRIVASDTDGSSETLEGLIQVSAGIQPGDSGGPLADSEGRVVGIDVAASRDDPRFSFSGGSAGEAYAIPIQKALNVAQRIRSGTGGDGIHIGATRGILGVGVGDSRFSDSGALVSRVASGSPADDAGISNDALITSIDGKAVASASALTRVMAPYGPNDRVRVTWTDDNGDNHRATISLESAPPA